MEKNPNGAGSAAKGNVVAIIAMFFMFAMISFVTNLAAPIGTIWGNQYEGNTVLGMLGNMMNFLAYLFMGIPAGKMLVKIGYKKTALIALVVGIVGLFVQWLSSQVGMNVHLGELVSLNFIIYLLGAFICGFSVCMLNTVVNPMLNLLGGGGNRGNQLVQSGGALNSLAGTLTPMFVGALIGMLTYETTIAVVVPLLWIGMGIFAFAFIVISCVAIPEPHMHKGKEEVKYSHSPWSFRHTLLGVIGIFFYVGVEVGIPGTLNFYLSDTNIETGAGIVGAASLVAGVIVAIYWLFMLVGRLVSSAISAKVSSRTQLIATASVGVILVVAAIFTPKTSRMPVPDFVYDPVEKTTEILTESGVPAGVIETFVAEGDSTIIADYAPALNAKFKKTPSDMAKGLAKPDVPVSALLLILCGLCTSVMWGGIFNLAVEGLGKYTAQASGIFMMMVVGGGVMPLIQSGIADACGYMVSYWLVVAMLIYILYYGLFGCKNVNTDIPVNE